MEDVTHFGKVLKKTPKTRLSVGIILCRFNKTFHLLSLLARTLFVSRRNALFAELNIGYNFCSLIPRSLSPAQIWGTTGFADWGFKSMTLQADFVLLS